MRSSGSRTRAIARAGATCARVAPTSQATASTSSTMRRFCSRLLSEKSVTRCGHEPSGYVGRMSDSGLSGDRVLRHREAAARHEQAALRHEESASYWLAQGDEALAELDSRCADVERAAAEVERDRADLFQRRDQGAACEHEIGTISASAFTRSAIDPWVSPP
jgi:hypothetical protein